MGTPYTRVYTQVRSRLYVARGREVTLLKLKSVSSCCPSGLDHLAEPGPWGVAEPV